MLGKRQSTPSSSFVMNHSSSMAAVIHNHVNRHSSFGISLKQIAVFSIWIIALLVSITTSFLMLLYRPDINTIPSGPAHWWRSEQNLKTPKTNGPLLSSLLRRAHEGVQSLQKAQNGIQEQYKQSILVPLTPAEVASPIHFQWKCADQCSCLPPVRDDVIYMHQSYNVKNQTYWPKSWVAFRQSWLDHHANEGWVFVFWLDKHNDLLARCTGYETLFQGRSFIQKADLSRLLYLHKYGGLYADMDYLALKSQAALLNEHPLLKDMQILLQGRVDQVVGIEYALPASQDTSFGRFAWTITLGQSQIFWPPFYPQDHTC
jgi:hypothetical protein